MVSIFIIPGTVAISRVLTESQPLSLTPLVERGLIST
jgi:hypothetical protein